MNRITAAIVCTAAALSIAAGTVPAPSTATTATSTARIVDARTGDVLATVEVPDGCTAIYRGAWDGAEDDGLVEDGQVNVWDGARARIDVVDGNGIRATTGVVWAG